MSTANICLSYAVETMAGVRPTSGYIMMPEVTEAPISNALLLVMICILWLFILTGS